MKLYVDARWVRTDFHDGISRYTAGIIKGLTENKIPFTVIIHDKKQLKMIEPDVPFVLFDNPLSINELSTAKRLNQLGAEIVFSPFQIFGSWGRKFKLLLTLHDTIYYLHPQAPTYLPLGSRIVWRIFHLTKWPQRMLLNSADRVVTVSNYSKKNIQKLKLTKREICVIYNAPSHIDKTAESDKKLTKNILYMGSFMPYKNVEVLIKGMNLIPHEYTLHLLSKISTERKAELSKLVGEGVKVEFHNGTSDEDYIGLLRNAFCMASASKEEGFGLPIIEAMQIGTPVVCSDMEIFHEVAGDGALFFDFDSPNEFAEQVTKLSNPQTRQELIDKGFEQAKKFTWKQSTKTLYDICLSLYKV
jgi:glycosyltransferase involved in cell wall biosynthesis